MTKRTVLHVINGEYYAGAERVQDLLGSELTKHGYAVCFAGLKDGVFDKNRGFRNSPFRAFEPHGGLDLFRGFRVAAWAKEVGAVIVHSHTPRSGIVAVLVAHRLGIPHVHHLHSPTLRDTENPIRNRIKAFLEKIALLNADRVIAVSSAVGKYALSEGVRPERLRVVLNGVSASAKLQQPRQMADVVTFGMVALFRARKGVECLLQAFSLLRARCPAARLRMVGGFESAAYEDSVRELASGLGLDEDIDWVGFTHDVPGELAKMDVMVVPSLYGEGLPMVLLEAMAAGLPIVASRVEGIPEALTEGEQGFLVEPGDAVALGQALVRLASDAGQRAEMGKRARTTFDASFSSRRMGEAVADVYKELTGE